MTRDRLWNEWIAHHLMPWRVRVAVWSWIFPHARVEWSKGGRSWWTGELPRNAAFQAREASDVGK